MRILLLALSLLALAAPAAAAVEIRRYDTRVDVGDDGAGFATATLDIAGAAAGRLRVPVGFGPVADFRAGDLPPGVTVTLTSGTGASTLELELAEGVPAAFKLPFTYRVPGLLFVPKPEEGQKPAFPAGSRLLRHAFVNTQPATIGRYEMTMRLPGASIVHAVREQLPKPKRKEFQPRVELDRFDGQQGAKLQFAGLKQGDRTSMEIEVVDAKRPWFWLLALLPFAVGYLWFFRDLVAPGKAA